MIADAVEEDLHRRRRRRRLRRRGRRAQAQHDLQMLVVADHAEAAGYVTAVEVADNQPVRSGDVLFRFDDRDYRARLAQAVANVAAAEARLANIEPRPGRSTR